MSRFRVASGFGCEKHQLDQTETPPSLRAKRSNLGPPPLPYDPLDCFVASLLAMTGFTDDFTDFTGLYGDTYFKTLRCFTVTLTSSPYCRPRVFRCDSLYYFIHTR